jgi:chemotaxis protein methyltransferase CheR
VAAGIDLSSFRSEHVDECVRRALEREELPGRHALADLLTRDAAARTRFRRSVAVSVTGIFRDAHQFDELGSHLPRVRAAATKGALRVWSAGCAGGAELVSARIALERAGALGNAFLLGSDLLDENIEAARAGAAGTPGLAPAGRTRFEVRDVVAQEPPAGAWSVVICRNVAIYLTPESKSLLHSRLASAVAGGGVLMLGRSERLARPDELGLARLGAHIYGRPA